MVRIPMKCAIWYVKAAKELNADLGVECLPLLYKNWRSL